MVQHISSTVVSAAPRAARSTPIAKHAADVASDAGTGSSVRDALARALGDPSLELGFWVEERSLHLDGAGHVVDVSHPGPGRAVRDVLLGGRRVGTIVYDPCLVADAALALASAPAVGLAIAHERLALELCASHEALRATGKRIVEAADRERRRIARDLHDGLQSRLVLLAVHANGIRNDPLASSSTRAQATMLELGLRDAITDLRELVQGVVPAALTESGLRTAVENLLDRVPIPATIEASAVDRESLPAAAESAGYFIVSEAVTNAVKHSGARALSVRLQTVDGWLRVAVQDDGKGGAEVGAGTGLRSIADRVEALGGRVLIDSPPGAGTAISAWIPSGSPRQSSSGGAA